MKREGNTEKTKEAYITSNFNISYNVPQVWNRFFKELKH